MGVPGVPLVSHDNGRLLVLYNLYFLNPNEIDR